MSVAVIIAIVVACTLGTMLVCGGLFAAFVFPTLVLARDSAQRMQCSNNVAQIGLALHSYESDYKQLPPAYTVDADGNRLHSWRTLILPYVGQQALYSRIDLSKPWDDPANAFLQEIDLPMFRCPSSKIAPGMTTYLVIDHPSSAFPGSTGQELENITDGLSNTILVVESNDVDAVHWSEPKDLSLSSYLSANILKARPTNAVSTVLKRSHRSGRHVVMGDGSTQFVMNNTNQEVLKGLATCQGGETVELDSK